MAVKKFAKKMSKENQPLPQTIIKGCLDFSANSSKRQLKQRVFCPFFTRLHLLLYSKQPLINHHSDLALKCVRSVSKWIDSDGFRFMMKQWNSKEGKFKKQLATVIIISIPSHFLFHMGAAQICSALSHIRNTREWKEEIIVATFETNWAKLRTSEVFMEILAMAKERTQKGRVTVTMGAVMSEIRATF